MLPSIRECESTRCKFSRRGKDCGNEYTSVLLCNIMLMGCKNDWQRQKV